MDAAAGRATVDVLRADDPGRALRPARTRSEPWWRSSPPTRAGYITGATLDVNGGLAMR